MEINHYYKDTIANIGKTIFKVVDKTDYVYHIIFTPIYKLDLQATFIANGSSAVEIIKDEFLRTIK